jgi:hypothetical protein
MTIHGNDNLELVAERNIIDKRLPVRRIVSGG